MMAYFRDVTEQLDPAMDQADRGRVDRDAWTGLSDNAVSRAFERLAGNRRCDIIGWLQLTRVHYAHAQQVTAYKGEWFKSSS